MLGIHAGIFYLRSTLGRCLFCQGRTGKRKEIVESDIYSSAVCTVQHHACCSDAGEEEIDDRRISPSITTLAG